MTMPPTHLEPWNEPEPTPVDTTGRRAAAWVWALAGIEVVLTACCSLVFAALAVLPPAQIEQSLTEGGADERQIRMILDMIQSAGVLALGYAVLGLVPALVLAGAAFGVQRGRRWAIALCMVIVLMQMLIVGAMLLMSIAAAVASGQPGQATLGVIVLGSLLALMGFTFKHLLAARQATATINPDAEPWNPTSR